MAKTEPFDRAPERYDSWFDRHPAAYRSELAAIRTLWPEEGPALEIGVGTGRFAAPLGITHAVDPSGPMRERAAERGITAVEGVAEDLPYPAERFARVLMTTTLCYLDDPAQAFAEAYRVLQPGGAFVVGFIDGSTALATRLKQQADSEEDGFYTEARFHAADETEELLQASGFTELTARQTLFSDPEAMETPDPTRSGHGEGGSSPFGAENRLEMAKSSSPSRNEKTGAHFSYLRPDRPITEEVRDRLHRRAIA